MFGTVNLNPYEYGVPTYERYLAYAKMAYDIGRGPAPLSREAWLLTPDGLASRSAEDRAAAAAAQQAWVASRANDILAACPSVGWPGPRGVGVVPCSIDEARRRAELEWAVAHVGAAGVYVGIKTTPPLPPSEVAPVNAPLVAQENVVTAPTGGGTSPLLWFAAGAGLLFVLSRRGRRA